MVLDQQAASRSTREQNQKQILFFYSKELRYML